MCSAFSRSRGVLAHPLSTVRDWMWFLFFSSLFPKLNSLKPLTNVSPSAPGVTAKIDPIQPVNVKRPVKLYLGDVDGGSKFNSDIFLRFCRGVKRNGT